MKQTAERTIDLDLVLQPIGHEQRRTPRLLRLIPLTLSLGSHSLAVQTAVISANGALILSSEPVPAGTPIGLLNPKTGELVEGWVVWTGLVTLSPNSPSLFQFKLGVEFLLPAAEFWGSDYDPETASGR